MISHPLLFVFQRLVARFGAGQAPPCAIVVFFTFEAFAFGVAPEAVADAMFNGCLFFPAAFGAVFGFLFVKVPHAVFFQFRFADFLCVTRCANGKAAPGVVGLFFTNIAAFFCIVPEAEINAMFDGCLLFPAANGRCFGFAFLEIIHAIFANRVFALGDGMARRCAEP